MSVATKLTTFRRAVARLTAATKEAATWPGDRDYRVDVQIVGLERPESDRMLGAVMVHEQIDRLAAPLRLPELEREKRCILKVEVVRVSSPLAAGSLVLDTVRAALADTKLTGKVTSVGVLVTGGPVREYGTLAPVAGEP